MKLEKLEKKAQKATQKVEKARKKLPKKKRIRRIRTFDEESGKAKKEWAVTKEEQLEKRRLLKKGAKAVTTSAVIKAHGKISQVEKENAAVEAAHATEQKVENTIRFVNHHRLLVHHQLPESTQTHVHRVGDAIQPFHPLSSPSPPALNLSQHQGLFQ